MTPVTMPYITEPPWARWSQLVALSARYVCLVLVGILACDVDGYSPLLAAAGIVVALTSGVALVGVLSATYRVEWVCLSPLIAALGWVAVIIGPAADHVVTLLVIGLAIAQTDRLVHLTRVASKLRALSRG